MEDVSRLCTPYTLRQMMCSHVASQMHAARMNKQIEETIGVQTLDLGSTVVVVWVVEGTVQTDTMSWTTQATPAPAAVGRGTRTYHLRIHDDHHL